MGKKSGSDLVNAPVIKVRVRGTWRVLDRDWAELRLQVKVREGWMDLVEADYPLIVARRFTGSPDPARGDLREAPELSVISALKKYLGAAGVGVELSGSEYRAGDAVNEWRYWARLYGPLSVAMITRRTGTVSFIPLD